IDGGKTWRPIFDSIPEIQTVAVNTSSGTFTLTFGGQTTAPINAASVNLARDIQNALDALPNIGGVGGLVTVARSGNAFRVTFGGTLIGADVGQITGSAGVSTGLVQGGRDPRFAMYVGAITLDPNDPNP